MSFGGEKVGKKLKQTKLNVNQLSGAVKGSGQDDYLYGEISLAKPSRPEDPNSIELDPDQAGSFKEVDKDSK